MSQIDRSALRRQLAEEFRGLKLHDWYVQYRELKASCPDTILLYRLGDFYETFDDDAKLAADQLGVTLTSKEFATRNGVVERCPMAGMPYHAVDRYVGTLVTAGYRVAIAEQTSETPSSRSDTRPKSVYAMGIEQTTRRKGMVDREIVRVITPGTIIDTGMLPAVQNNYLVALIKEGDRIGLAYADLSTGESACTEFSGDRVAIQAQGELARLQAVELLVPEDEKLRLPGLEPASARLTHDLEFMTKEERELLLPNERVARRVERENTARWAHGHITGLPDWRWDLRNARDALLHQFGVDSLAGFGLDQKDRRLAMRAAGALIQYVHETQRATANQIDSLHVYTTGFTMFLDPQTRRNLELLEGSGGNVKGSLVSVLDQTRTPMGARLLRRWLSQPLIDVERLTARQNSVASFVDDAMMRAEVREQLKHIGDMERIVNRVIQGITVTTPRDMARLREALRALPAVAEVLGGWTPPEDRPDTIPTPSTATDQEEWEFEEPTPPRQHTASTPTSRAPSLREQRESRRTVAARWETEDLFGEEAWGEEPAPLPAPEPPPPAPTAAPKRIVPKRIPTGASRQNATLDPCSDVLDFLEQAIDDDPPALLGASNYLRGDESGDPPRRVIRPGFDPDMDKVVIASRDAKRWIDQLEEEERKRTEIKNLRVDYNKVFGYYIEVPKSYINQVPPDYIRKQTVATAERYFTAKLKDYENIVVAAQERLVELEQRAFGRICAAVAAEGARLLATARMLAEIDVYAGLAEAAVRGRYVRPRLFDDTRLRVVAGRHPVVEQTLDGEFVPNNFNLDTSENTILLVTGPNMAGKSTTLRQVALIVLMAQIGSFVPADEAEIGLVDRIFTRIGAQDDIATGRSTFMVEMTETAALLLQSTHRSLIILDEVGRGTSTYDGMAIAQAVIEYIHNEPRLSCRTLFATHYHELTELEHLLPRVKNYHMAAVEQDDRVVFLHELRRGGTDRSYGIHVAELAGIPRPVIRRAQELLTELEHKRTNQPVAHGINTDTAGPETNGGTTHPTDPNHLGLFDLAPNPAIELLRRLNINELSPIEAMTKLYELQKLAKQ